MVDGLLDCSYFVQEVVKTGEHHFVGNMTMFMTEECARCRYH